MLKGLFAKASKFADDTIKKYNDGDFVNGLAATAALIATADGEVEEAELKGVGELFAQDPLFEPFDKTLLVNRFYEYATKAGSPMLRPSIVEIAVKGAKGNADRADKMLSIAQAVANADGEFEDTEKAAVRQLAGKLGLNAANYGV